MAWFGEGPMDGDTPRDYRGDLLEGVCGLHWDDDACDWPDLTAEILAENETGLAAYCAEGDDPIAYEVWAYLLVTTPGASVQAKHKAAIVAAIERDIADIPNQRWVNPAERTFELNRLQEQIEVLGTSKVVDLHSLIRKRLVTEIQAAIQRGFDDATDTTVTPRVVADMLWNTVDDNDIVDYAGAAKALALACQAMAKAVEAGLPLDDAVRTARPHAGA